MTLIYDLDINFTFGQIGINTHKGYLDPDMNIQGRFKLKKTDPDISISSKQPQINDIDLSQCRAEIGCPSPDAAARIWHDEAKQYVLNYIGQKAADGDALGAIERGVSIADIVSAESFSDPPEFNVDLVPKSRPRISFEMGHVMQSSQYGRIQVDIEGEAVTSCYERAHVNIFMEQNPYIDIKAVPKGKNIDKIV
jgi:hypothetical protein